MKLTLSQASKECGKAKSTISKAIKNGKISAERKEDGSFAIDPAELFRVYPKPTLIEQTINRKRKENAPDNTLISLELAKKEMELQSAINRVDELKAREAELKQEIINWKEQCDKWSKMAEDNMQKLLESNEQKKGFWSFFKR